MNFVYKLRNYINGFKYFYQIYVFSYVYSSILNYIWSLFEGIIFLNFYIENVKNDIYLNLKKNFF